jgi:hypothetical protein
MKLAISSLIRKKPSFALCCVLDDNPRFYVEFVLWVLCIRQNLPPSFRPVVYAVGHIPEDLRRWAGVLDVRVVQGAPLVQGSPHSNKIAPFFDKHGTDVVIVCDTDLFFVADPSGLFGVDRFRACPNNASNPPPRIFRSILAESGLGKPYRPGIALIKGSEGLRETHINNISAGIVAAPSSRARALAECWHQWAVWLAERKDLLEIWAVHLDQVAFALAMEDLGEDVEFLPPQVNTVLELLNEISSCYALHLTTGHIPLFPQLFHPDRTLVPDNFNEGIRIHLDNLNLAIRKAVSVISSLPSTRGHLDKFMNPAYLR